MPSSRSQNCPRSGICGGLSPCICQICAGNIHVPSSTGEEAQGPLNSVHGVLDIGGSSSSLSFPSLSDLTAFTRVVASSSRTCLRTLGSIDQGNSVTRVHRRCLGKRAMVSALDYRISSRGRRQEISEGFLALHQQSYTVLVRTRSMPLPYKVMEEDYERASNVSLYAPSSS